MPVKGKILFDLGHGEARLDALRKRLPDEGFLYDVTEQPLTLDKLRQYTTVVLNIPHEDLSGDEAQDLYEYVSKNGGGVVQIVQYADDFEYKNHRLDQINANAYGLLGGRFKLKYRPHLDDPPYYKSWSITAPKYLCDDIISRFRIQDYFNLFEPHDIIFNGYEIHPHETTKGLKFLLKGTRFPKECLNFFKLDDIVPPQTSSKIVISSSLKFPIEPLEFQEKLKNQVGIFSVDVCSKILEHANKELSEFYGHVGVVGMYNKGRCAGFTVDFFDDLCINEDREKNANLRLALSILEWTSQPTLTGIKEIDKKYPFVYS